MADDDYTYFHQHAETELEKAQQAADPKAVAAHHQLAEPYTRRVSSLATNGPVKRDAA